MIVLVVSLSIERLVAVFKYSHETPAHLVYAACIGLMTSLLVAWGLFVRLNQSAGQLEPEALEQTKQEDRNVQ
jgi:sensor histidine kinase regulating citrate/malate metabolism